MNMQRRPDDDELAHGLTSLGLLLICAAVISVCGVWKIAELVLWAFR